MSMYLPMILHGPCFWEEVRILAYLYRKCVVCVTSNNWQLVVSSITWKYHIHISQTWVYISLQKLQFLYSHIIIVNYGQTRFMENPCAFKALHPSYSFIIGPRTQPMSPLLSTRALRALCFRHQGDAKTHGCSSYGRSRLALWVDYTN